VNDASDFAVVQRALDVLAFTADDKKTMWTILAAILHLGNVQVSFPVII
jgi:myosin heavy subunit